MRVLTYIKKYIWLKRCQNRFIERCPYLEKDEAKMLAQVCFDTVEHDLTESPTDCADEELSYWDTDELGT